MGQISPKTKQAAKELYFSHIPISEISKKTGVKYHTILAWVQGKTHIDKMMRRGWKYDREDISNEIIEQLKTANSEPIAKIFKVGLPLVHNALVNRALEDQAGKKITIPEAKQIVDILEKFDKMLRLSEGLATDIVEIKSPMSINQIREIFEKDPFYGDDDDTGTEIGNGREGEGPLQVTSGEPTTRVVEHADPFAESGGDGPTPPSGA